MVVDAQNQFFRISATNPRVQVNSFSVKLLTFFDRDSVSISVSLKNKSGVVLYCAVVLLGLVNPLLEFRRRVE